MVVLGNERADWLEKAATKRKIDIDVNIPKSFYKKITKERMEWRKENISSFGQGYLRWEKRQGESRNEKLGLHTLPMRKIISPFLLPAPQRQIDSCIMDFDISVSTNSCIELLRWVDGETDERNPAILTFKKGLKMHLWKYYSMKCNWRGGCQRRRHPRHLTMVQNYVVAKNPRDAEQCDVNIHSVTLQEGFW
ncbi:hypothetical protein TNCV_1169831 [Trichonephila clavipes]|uniref:Uncharacterized protein n=1 Tax=Trichonephila clavipes TaxID=2585209 RepID=A0A8X6SXH9_TRICX|nr:hypothetical protein TNCV_1169831 [Trichonephila clavipes]